MRIVFLLRLVKNCPIGGHKMVYEYSNRLIGKGKIVVEQYPKKGETIVSTSKVFLKTNGTKIKMIDITGWNRAEVITFMNMIGVDYEINGTGKVLNFNIKVGEVIKEKVIISMESRFAKS